MHIDISPHISHTGGKWVVTCAAQAFVQQGIDVHVITAASKSQLLGQYPRFCRYCTVTMAPGFDT